MVIAVLGGSPSPEHDVSLASAIAVVKAILRWGCEVLPVYIDRAGFWHLGNQLLNPGGPTPLDQLFVKLESSSIALPIGKACGELKLRRTRLVFPALHGVYGEDGFVQAHLEGAGLDFVGSSSLSSGLAMSKRKTWFIFKGAGLPVAKAWHPEPQEAKRMNQDEFLRRLETLGFSWPLFLKADHSGSTLGVFKLRNIHEAATGLASVRKVDSQWMIEEGVPGPEITVGVIGNADASVVALPPVEIKLKRGDLFDYQSKYDPNAVDEICPAPSLGQELESKAKELAVSAHRILDCRGFSRTDMILGPDGLVLLETNTIPGLTPVSLFPKAGLAAGFSFPSLIHRICLEALPKNRKGLAEYPEEGKSLDTREKM
jgi:D-alanine-D-alanine ligase